MSPLFMALRARKCGYVDFPNKSRDCAELGKVAQCQFYSTEYAVINRTLLLQLVNYQMSRRNHLTVANRERAIGQLLTGQRQIDVAAFFSRFSKRY